MHNDYETEKKGETKNRKKKALRTFSTTKADIVWCYSSIHSQTATGRG
jgi:hypothetical protein